MERQYSPNRLTLSRKFIAASAFVHLFAFSFLPDLHRATTPPTAMTVQWRAPAPAVNATAPTATKTALPPPAESKPRREPRPATPPPLLTRALAPEIASPTPTHSLAVTAPPPTSEAPPLPAVTAAIPTPLPATGGNERRGKPSTLWLANYTRTISGQVGRLKQYPQIARLRGWQGTTIISIQLAADGTVLHTRIEQSSGHDVLDSQALAMVRQAEPLPPFPERHDNDPLTVQLPIVFALAGPG